MIVRTGKDLCLIGERGAGKSFVARHFARATGYAPVETVFIYSDMTARDLLHFDRRQPLRVRVEPNPTQPRARIRSSP